MEERKNSERNGINISRTGQINNNFALNESWIFLNIYLLKKEKKNKIKYHRQINTNRKYMNLSIGGLRRVDL